MQISILQFVLFITSFLIVFMFLMMLITSWFGKHFRIALFTNGFVWIPAFLYQIYFWLFVYFKILIIK